MGQTEIWRTSLPAMDRSRFAIAGSLRKSVRTRHRGTNYRDPELGRTLPTAARSPEASLEPVWQGAGLTR
jgi:hypothetical protein